MSFLPIKPFERLPYFNFMKWRPIWIWGSVLITVAIIAMLAIKGLNWGIDFVGGKLLEVQTAQVVELSDLRRAVEDAGFGGAVIQEYGAPNDFIIRLPGNDPKANSESAQADVVNAIGAIAGGAELRRVEFVGPQVGEELSVKGAQASIVSILAILIYLAMRFELRFGLGAVISLTHDVMLILGIITLMRIEMNLTILAAILTLIGYSLNETIVIYDRVRENRAKFPNIELNKLINDSVNQTLGRTIMTGGSVLLVLWSLYLFGGESIKDFSFILIMGVVLGTYSSIFVSSTTLLVLEEYYQRMAKEDAKAKL